jgi:hypothetical protein
MHGFRGAFALTMVSLAAMSLASPPGEISQSTIPEKFQGTWDANANACSAAASDMRYHIGPDRMRFGDAVGRVRSVIPHDQSVSVRTSFRSDGDPWNGVVRLSLSPSGDELTVQTGNSRTTRFRCSTGG